VAGVASGRFESRTQTLVRESGIDTSALDATAATWTSQARTVVFAAIDGKAAAAFAIADTLRANSATVVQSLKRRGLRVVMLSGDRQATANVIARQAGVDEVIAEVLPDGKVEAIKSLQQGGHRVAGTAAIVPGPGIVWKVGTSKERRYRMDTNFDLRRYGGANAYLQGCPSRDVLDMVGNKWTILIVPALHNGPMRFGEPFSRVVSAASTMTLVDGPPEPISMPVRSLEMSFGSTPESRIACSIATWFQAEPCARKRIARRSTDPDGSSVGMPCT